MAAVAQGLQPLGLRRSYHQGVAPERQGPAVRGQLGARDFWPGLPEGRQAAFALPLPFQMAEALP